MSTSTYENGVEQHGTSHQTVGTRSAYNTEISSSLRTAVVIVTYNSAQDIGRCLGMLANACRYLCANIIVVDNASSDDTCAIVARERRARLIRNDSNRGFAAAVNQGVAATTAEHILILNPDVVVTPEALSSLMEALNVKKDYAAAGCNMVFPNSWQELPTMQYPTVATFLKRVLFTNHLVNKFHHPEQLNRSRSVASDPSSGVKQVDWIIGGCMMIRRSAYDVVGPLDEAYFLYYEDTDWCYRAHLRGWKIGFLPDTWVIHDYKRSSSKISFSNNLTWIHLTSAIRFFVKVAPTRKLRTIA